MSGASVVEGSVEGYAAVSLQNAAVRVTVASITTVGHAAMAPARMERRLWIRADEPVVHAAYRIVNLDVRPLPFLWGIHPVFAVAPGRRIEARSRSIGVGDVTDHVRPGASVDARSAASLKDRASMGL